MHAKTVKELGALLRQTRVGRGETQAGLASRIGVTQSAVSKVEKGSPGASIGLIFQMLKALELPLTIGSQDRAALTAPSGAAHDDVDLDAIANTGLRRRK